MVTEIIVTETKHGCMAGHEIRTFRATGTTHFAAGQPSINLRVSVGTTSKKLIRFTNIYANCFCAWHIDPLTPKISSLEIRRESAAIVCLFKLTGSEGCSH